MSEAETVTTGVQQDDLEWLKRRAGVDDVYLARWPRGEWDESVLAWEWMYG